MSTKAPDHPVQQQQPHHATGDSIAQDIKCKGSNATDLSDVAKSLTDAHAHRPGLWQQDLDKANNALHAQGILSDVQIVGVKGQDLITKAKDGHTEVYDSTNLNYHHKVDTSGKVDSFGTNKGKLEYNPDGSGKYTVAGKDNDWTISRDLLKNDGITNPTNNQTANYIKELQKANPGKDISKLHPGDVLNVPTASMAGDNTSFTGDRIEGKAKTDSADVQKQADQAVAAVKKYGDIGIGGADSAITRAGIDKALADPSKLSADEKAGLEFLKKNFDSLTYKGGEHWYSNLLRQDAVWPGGVEGWATAQQKKIDDLRAMSYGP